MKRKIPCISVVLVMLMTVLMPFDKMISYAAENDAILYTRDFEDENLSGWASLGGDGKVVLSDEAAHSGEKSLKVIERVKSYNGPSISLESFVMPNNTYTFSSWAYHNSDSTKTLSLVAKYLDSLGSPHYVPIETVDVEKNQWVEIAGTIDFPEDSMGYLIYFECSNAEVDFYVDDITITGPPVNENKGKDEDDGSLYIFDFENGNEFWSARGYNRVVRTDEFSYTGTHSIYTTNREKAWNGPTVNVDDIRRGVDYFYSAYVMYDGQEYEDEHGFRIEVSYNINGENIYQLIKEKTLKKGKWTRITGTYTLPDNAADVFFYVQTSNIEEGETADINDLMSFYTDTVKITETSLIHRQTALIALSCLAGGIIISLVIGCICSTVIKKSAKKKATLKSISRDAMTKAFNRNSYEKKLNELSQNPELCKSLCFALCDVNFLKYINDNHGHEKGDEAIKRCAKLLMETVGSRGEVYRTGGDEFVCIVKEPIQSDIAGAIEKESKIDEGYPFAVAVGFAEYDSETDGDSPDIKAIMERCDQEMYANKQEIKSKNKKFSRK